VPFQLAPEPGPVIKASEHWQGKALDIVNDNQGTLARQASGRTSD
jgi:hypothetical protein